MAHEYDFKSKYDGGKSEMVAWVGDSITKKRWAMALGKSAFQNQNLETVSDDIQTASDLSCIYPDRDGGSLDCTIGQYNFHLSECNCNFEDLP